MPKHYPVHDKSMAQVVDARPAMTSAINPTQFVTQFAKDPMYLAVAQRRTQQSAPRANEERGFCGGRYLATTQLPVAGQRQYGAWVQRQQPRLFALAQANCQRTVFEVNI